ncbi:DUF917 domain-containing protein [Ferrimonas marina]|uniref:DUF917 domain-containing protein n=1 Tax=Ferrimonas marina TaxID=299255 RepID=A0A1M5RYD9_9GAMM|nr:DUF917 domain-containing protein [Ferrimonas marina]SHH31048.1 hypothetical protein SAMN02745129_1793 [Ferrimonas marina]
MKHLDKQDLIDILHGCAVLGTGGGGELDEGFEYLDRAFAANKPFRLVSLDEAPDEALICTPYMLGAISPMPPEQEAQYRRLPQSGEPPIDTAYRRLSQYLGQPFYGTVCCELGGSNTAISFYVAAMNDGMIIDADPAGRAVPEITHSTYYLNDLPAAPIVAANEFGECFVLEQVVDDQRAETLVRALSMVSRNDIAAIDHALPVSQLRSALIPGTISKALALGKALRLAKEEGSDVAVAIAEHGQGRVVFRGQVSEFDWRTEGGFTLGEVSIDGSGEFQSHDYRIDIKNENLAGWLDGQLHATIPELLCLIDLDKGEPVLNPNHRVGMNVAVVILPAPAAFVTERGLAAFGPSYLGLDRPFTPVLD